MNKRIIIAVLAVFSLLSVVRFAQSQTNTEANPGPANASVSPSPAAATAAPENAQNPKEEKLKRMREAYKSVADTSQSLNGWCLLIIAASIATIVSTSYFRPAQKWFRALYLLFLPGWFFIALAAYRGFSLTQWYISLQVNKPEFAVSAMDGIDNDFWWQMLFFQLGLVFFAVWLVAFLILWVLDDRPVSN
ncbi:MAG TPA: hypothetical protein VGC97_02175 [Pyrinomonadaceae bacterium]